MRLPKIEIDLNDYPEVVAAFEEADGSESEALADRISDEMHDIRDEVKKLRGTIEDARRMLLRAEPSTSEALIYIERALVDAASIERG